MNRSQTGSFLFDRDEQESDRIISITLTQVNSGGMKSSSMLHLSRGQKVFPWLSACQGEKQDHFCLPDKGTEQKLHKKLFHVVPVLGVTGWYVSCNCHQMVRTKSSFSLTQLKMASTKVGLCSTCLEEQVATWVSPHQVGNTTIVFPSDKGESSPVRSSQPVLYSINGRFACQTKANLKDDPQTKKYTRDRREYKLHKKNPPACTCSGGTGCYLQQCIFQKATTSYAPHPPSSPSHICAIAGYTTASETEK